MLIYHKSTLNHYTWATWNPEIYLPTVSRYFESMLHDPFFFEVYIQSRKHLSSDRMSGQWHCVVPTRDCALATLATDSLDTTARFFSGCHWCEVGPNPGGYPFELNEYFFRPDEKNTAYTIFSCSAIHVGMIFQIDGGALGYSSITAWWFNCSNWAERAMNGVIGIAALPITRTPWETIVDLATCGWKHWLAKNESCWKHRLKTLVVYDIYYMYICIYLVCFLHTYNIYVFVLYICIHSWHVLIISPSDQRS